MLGIGNKMKNNVWLKLTILALLCYAYYCFNKILQYQ